MAHPDLGRFVRTESDNIHAGINIWSWTINGKHQLLHRVAGGDAGLWQRVLVYMRNAPAGQDPLPPGDIDFIMGGEIWPTPTDWSRVQTHDGTWTYYFAGQSHRDGGWRWDRGLRVRRDYHQNGVALTISYDDAGSGDGDYNDYIIEANVLWVYSFDAKAKLEGTPKRAYDKEDSLASFRDKMFVS